MGSDNQRKLIYVCQPLDISLENIKKAKHYCEFLTGLGYHPFSPVLYYSTFLDLNKKKDRYLALLYAIDMIKKCDSVFIFSNKVTSAMYAELEAADLYEKPVKYNLLNEIK